LGPFLVEAGIQLTDAELKTACEQLDINGDGRILYENLRSWVYSGHRMRRGWIGDFIKRKGEVIRKAKEV
jgi:Ca2+-binding EF-hand superfamily protein